MEAFGLIASLVPLLIIGGIVAGIVAVVRRSGGEETEPGIGSLRRIFLYGLAFVALMLATVGVTMLLDQIVDSLFFEGIIRGQSFKLAFGLAATMVGFPIWALLWMATQRSVERYPPERGTLGRKVYLYLVMGVSAAIAAGFLVRIVSQILEPSEDALSDIAWLVVWSALWAVHWIWETTEGQPSPISKSVRRLYLYATSTYGLILLALGAGLMLTTLLASAYDGMFGGTLLRSRDLWSDAARTAMAMAAVGGLWWWFHWHRESRSDVDSVLRQIIIYVLGVFGGIVTVVTAAAIALQTTLRWVLDRPDFTTAVAQFDILPSAFATALVAGGVWAYHSTLVLHEAKQAGPRLPSARRAYRYLTAAVGLATLSVGLVLLIGVTIGLIVPSAQESIVGRRWWGAPLSTSLTLMLIGAPLWAIYWLRQQTATQASEALERIALSRRTFIFLVFGIGILATLGSLSGFIFVFLQAALDGELSAKVLDGGKWALATTLTAGVISAYHWQVLREDRLSAPAEAPPTAPVVSPKIVTAAAPVGAEAIVNAIATSIGVSITVWQRQDQAGTPELTPQQIDDIAERVNAAPGEQVLLVLDGQGVQVIPV
jgi:hypothetical protein